MSSVRISSICLSLSALALGLSSYMMAGLIPLMGADFNVSIGWAAQLVTAFTLSYGLLSPVLVGMTGHYDLKNNVCAYLGIFVIANAACVIVPEFYSLILLRAIAGGLCRCVSHLRNNRIDPIDKQRGQGQIHFNNNGGNGNRNRHRFTRFACYSRLFRLAKRYDNREHFGRYRSHWFISMFTFFAINNDKNRKIPI
ncbi:unnamed protein product [Bartonella apis]